MTRPEVIEALRRLRSLYNGTYAPALDEAIGIMQGADLSGFFDKLWRCAYERGKAEAVEWIPCSERLPDKDGRYLVTNSKWGSYHVDWNIYYAAGDRPGWLWEQGCTAWMPLPEPYEGGDDVVR